MMQKVSLRGVKGGFRVGLRIEKKKQTKKQYKPSILAITKIDM